MVKSGERGAENGDGELKLVTLKNSNRYENNNFYADHFIIPGQRL